MARIIQGMNNEGVKDLLYTRPDRLLDDYHANLFGDEGIARRFTEDILNKSKAKIGRLKSSRAVRAATGAYRKIKNGGRLDRIEFLSDIGSLQNAPPRMQHMVMSNIQARKLWLAGKLAGYENGFNSKPDQQNAIKHSHASYRMVMNGQVHKDDGEHVSHTYALTNHEQDTLSVIDVAEIRQTWGKVDEAIWAGVDDPTSEYNAML